jgi:hypothetical protein
MRIPLPKKNWGPPLPPAPPAIMGRTKGGISETSDMTSEGLGEMFEADYGDMCARKFPLMLMGGRAEGHTCADPGARTPIGVSGNFMSLIMQNSLSKYFFLSIFYLLLSISYYLPQLLY